MERWGNWSELDFCRRGLGAFEMTNREFSLKMSLIQRGLWLSPVVLTRIAVGCASPDQVRGNVEFRGCSFGSFLWFPKRHLGSHEAVRCESATGALAKGSGIRAPTATSSHL